MTDSINREVAILLRVIGGAQTQAELDAAVTASDNLTRSGKASTFATEALGKAAAAASRKIAEMATSTYQEKSALDAATKSVIAEERALLAEGKALDKATAARERANAALLQTGGYQRASQNVQGYINALTKARAAEAGTKTSEVGSRGYSNASVISDAGISARQAESAAFSAGLQKRMQAEAVATRELTVEDNKLAAARARVAAAQTTQTFEKSLVGLDAEQVATRRLTLANAELAASQEAVTVATTAGNQAQLTSALERQASAINGVTRAETALASSAGAEGQSLPRLRYALYDVSTTAAMTGAVFLGLTAITAGTAIAMDRQFADVVRTTGTYLDQTGQATAGLRQQFNDLFTSLPASWKSLTDVGTLAGQLGIATEDVSAFTSLVIKFSTVTGVSVDESATAFGRLSALLKVSSSEYENLGSAILATGVSSVATESQIIGISSQIASMGSYAGFTYDQVIGLSSAMASLGIAPEMARGTITRLFTKISVAIADGGDKLAAFGKIAGVSGQEFATAWGSDAAGSLQKLLAGLGQIDAQGGSSIAALTSLGVTAARDVPTLLKLAQNTQLVGDQFSIAAKGAKDGTAIQQQFGVVAETVSTKLSILKNNFVDFIATMGKSSGSLGGIIDFFSTIIKGMAALADNKFFTGANTLLLVISAVAGLALLAAGGLTRMGASMIAVQTAMAGMRLKLVETALATGGEAAAANIAASSNARLALSLTGVKAALISTGIGLALVALGTAIAYFAGQADKSKNSIGGLAFDIEGLKTAMSGDTQAAADGTAKSFETLTFYTDNYGNSLTSAQAQQLGYSDAMANLGKTTDGTTKSVNEQKIAVGELTKEWLYNQLTTGEFAKKFQDIWPQIQTLTESAGLDIGATLNKALSGEKVDFSALQKQIDDQVTIAKVTLSDALNQTGYGSDRTKLAQDNFDSLTKQSAAVEALSSFFSGLNGTIATTAQKMAIAKVLGDALGVSVTGAGTAAGDSSAIFDALAKTINDTIASYTDIQDAALTTQGALGTLGAGLQQGGLDWSQYSEAGRTNMGNLLSTMKDIAAESPGDASTIASNFQALYDLLINGGYATASQLGVLQDAIGGLKAQGATITNTGTNFSSFFNGWGKSVTKAATATAAAKKEVVTLLDYASQLSGVWGRAFDIRFNSQSTLDSISTTFLDMRDAADKSAQSIADLNREINGLATDISTQQYFLGVAVNYGDTLRAAEIQKTLLDLQAQMASKQGDLTDEQAKNSKVLTGNSKAAITNRKQMTDLVTEYEAHIKALAESGLSSTELAQATAQLKQQFIEQTTALGYASDEIMTYASAFDDVALAIQRIPRNITVTANADPAIQALNEFQAKLDATRASAASNPITPLIDTSSINNAALKSSLQAQIDGARAQMALPGLNSTAVNSIASVIYRLQAQIASLPRYSGGGFTGIGGMYEPAGVVHRGEYVVPQAGVDQRTGLPKADYIGNLSRSASNAPSYARGGYVGGMGYGGTLDLSAGSIQRLANVLQSKFYLDGRMFAQSVGNDNRRTTSQGAS